MNFKISPVLFALALGIISCNNEAEKTTTTTDDSVAKTPEMIHEPPLPDSAIVPMVSHAEAVIAGTYPDTLVNGTVKFDGDGNSGKVKMVLNITVPSKANKSVAVHLHEHGDCGDTAKMAHGHWNPTNSEHGKWGTLSFHSGDIGNIKLDAKGHGRLVLETDLWTLGGMPIKNILGKSVIVHGGVDDFTTQPTGNAGTRIGCGAIR